jgi:hypothetical protein
MEVFMITVVGSLNMDFVVGASTIPKPGETVLGSSFRKVPGGKGGNQAAAAARLGADLGHRLLQVLVVSIRVLFEIEAFAGVPTPD